MNAGVKWMGVVFVVAGGRGPVVGDMMVVLHGNDGVDVIVIGVVLVIVAF